MLTLQTLLQFRICAAQFLNAAAAAMKLWTSEPGLQSDYRDPLAITLYPDRPV